VNARTGAVLWSQKLGSGVISQPITYLAPDGRQYIAVASGIGGAAMVSAKMKGFPARGNTLYVFSIDGASLETGPGLKTTESTAPAIIPDSANTGRQ
jgi:alcohol dehydrogenase (cytochrome c)